MCCVAVLATYRAAQPRLHFVDLILFRRLCGRRHEQKRQNGKRTKISKFAETEEEYIKEVNQREKVEGNFKIIHNTNQK